MTRKEHLEFCRKCLNRKFDADRGLICSITGEIAGFEGSCSNFNLDETVREIPEEAVIATREEIMIPTDEKTIHHLKVHQDFNFAFIGGSLAMLTSAVIWAIITVAAKYQIGYMAIGVGLLVGFTVRFFGAGIDKKFGYLGAALSLLGCLLGNLFSQVGFIAQAQSLGYYETLSYLNFGIIVDIMVESFSPMDMLFYGFAIYEGYRFSFRRVTAKDIKNLQAGTTEGNPANSRLRMPLVIISIILLLFFIFKISQGVTGLKTYRYESGNIMSEGELKKGKENGKWTYWYENGKTQLVGFYSMGLQDGLWQWFDDSGKLTKTGYYKKGLEHGIWINFYQNGNVHDSGSYIDGRMNGEWKYRFEDGNLFQIGYYKRNIPDGIWKTYYENGQLSSVGGMKEGIPIGKWANYYDNGQPSDNIEYLTDNKISINETWDKEGKQIVIDGNGLYKSFSDNGQLILEGKVESGTKTGKWTAYYENGKIKEEGIFMGEVYRITSSWDVSGAQNIINGQGIYKSYYPESESILETGRVENGLKEGSWKVYSQTSDIVFQEHTYVKGKMTGIQKAYFESGQLFSSGEMKDDLMEGEWTWYYENGNKSSTVGYKKNKKEGKQIIWSETGIQTKEEIYEHGKLVDEKLY